MKKIFVLFCTGVFILIFSNSVDAYCSTPYETGWNYDSSGDEYDLNYTTDSAVGYASTVENVYSGYGDQVNHKVWIYNDHNQQQMRVLTGYETDSFRFRGFSEFSSGYQGVNDVSYRETSDPGNWVVSMTFDTSQKGEWSGGIIHFERVTNNDIWWEDFPYEGSSNCTYYHSVGGLAYPGAPFGLNSDGVGATGVSYY